MASYSSYFIPKKSQTTQQKVAEALGVKPSQVNPNVNQTTQPNQPAPITTKTSSKKSSGGSGSSQPTTTQLKPTLTKEEAVEAFKQIQKPIPPKKTEQNTLIERLTRGTGQYNVSARKGNISAGFQQIGTIVQNVGEEINKMKFPRIPTPLDFIPLTREIGKTRLPEEFTSGLFTGAGKTIKGAGDIVESASNKSNWENLFRAGKKSAEYWIDVGKQSELGLQINPGSAIPILPKVTFSKKTKQELSEAGIKGVGLASTAVTTFAENPGQNLGEFVGGGALLTGASSIGSKFIGFGKAGIKIAKGGKYIDYESLYETKPQNLIKGKYKKGTPTSTIKEFKTGKNPKTLFHSTGTDFINPKTGRAKVIAPAKSPKTDPKALFSSTGSANETYLRISGESYNLKPRIPFVNMPTKIKPTTYRLVGTTTPRKLTTLGKVKNLKQGKKLFETATTSKNIPYTSPANTLGIKAENEALLRPGTVLSKKGLKGAHDFTFVKGVFVETPRVRVMPSKPKLSNFKPSKAKIVENVKPSKSISFEESIRISKTPATIYNPASLFSSKSSVKSSGSKDYSSFFVSKKPGSSVKISNSIDSGFSPRPSPSPSPSSSPSPSPTPSPRPRGGSGRRGSGSGSSITITTSTSSTPPSRPSSSIPRLPPRKPPVYKPKLTLPYKPSLFMKKDYTRYKVKNVLTFNRKKVKKKGWLF